MIWFRQFLALGRRWSRGFGGRLAHRAGAIVVASLSLAVFLSSCDGDDCEGEGCHCEQGDTCYFGCSDDHCSLSCSQTDRCGGLCENDCDFRCSDVSECSALCQDDCTIDCSQISECGAICGDRCRYRCTQASRCGVEVGHQSEVDCFNVSSCEVECKGACIVNCGEIGRECVVTCAPGFRREPNGEQGFACVDE